MAQNLQELTAEEIREQIVRLGFAGDRSSFQRFCELLRGELPAGTAVALRGSVVTNEKWADGRPFDADGQGTSDLDVTLIGDRVMQCWHEDAFYIPGLHTKPLGDDDPECAPSLNALRQRLQQIARRPVNIQATNNLVLFARDVLLGQPYYMLVEAPA